MIDVVVLGATGYVGGELLRLVAGHPRLRLAAALSRSQAGERIAGSFPHLELAYPDTRFAPFEADLSGSGKLAILAAAPHGESASAVANLVERARGHGREVHLVDTSADFRHSDRELYAKIYGQPHGAPELLPSFHCGVPELEREDPGTTLLAHPGCFTTAVTLACAPLAASGVVSGPVFVSAVTGSTGSGKTPKPTTHHPERHGGFHAYQRVGHRHEPEMRALLSRAANRPVEVSFVPHSGPFARGIHVTVQGEIASGAPLLEAMAAFYEGCPFVSVTAETPRIKDVVGTNLCRLSAVQTGDRVVITGVIDNLVKGAAGGAIQWLNRSLRFDETAGLLGPGIGWN